MKSSQLQVGPYKIHYQETGQGFPLVFLHGFLASSLAWTDLISLLTPRYRCISLDLLGFGHSSQPDIPFSIDLQVSILRSLIETLELEKYALVGHSMGGWIASAYALQYQSSEIQRLVLLAPAGIRDRQFNLRYLPLLPLLLPGPWVDIPLALLSPYIEAGGFQAELQQLAKIRSFFRKRPVSTANMFERLLKNEVKLETIDHQLHQLYVPTLVIAGLKDRVIPYTHIQTYLERIPDAELLCFEDAKHDLHVSHAQRVANQLIQLPELNPMQLVQSPSTTNIIGAQVKDEAAKP